MANWCSNYLTFSGKEGDIEKVYEIFKKMQTEEQKTNNGQLPGFFNDISEGGSGWFFEIYLEEDQKERVQYETKWGPNVDDVVKIANEFDLDFKLEYSESGNNLYGCYLYNNKDLKDFYLEDTDFEDFDWDEDGDFETYKGEQIDSREEKLEEIFKEKFGFDI